MTSPRPFNWRFPFYTAVGTFAITVAIELSNTFDILTVLYFLAMPFVVLALLVLALFRRSYSVLSVSVIYCALSWVFLYAAANDVREMSRWLLRSRSLKAQALLQPSPNPEELRHLEWYGWGFAGADTTVYLIHDPSNQLGSAAKTHRPGKFPGIPCEVWRLSRLESHWYAATSYTNTFWDGC